MKRILYYWMVALLAGGFAAGCKSERPTGAAQEQVTGVENADTAFLSIEGDLNEYPALLWRNQETYLKAFERLESRVRIEDNRFVWDFKTAEEMRMSQNLFDYILSIWKDYNERLAGGEEEVYVNDVGHYCLRPKE